MQEYAIIVAGGTGTRMQSDIPKQFIAVNGLPILMHTIRAFRGYARELNIVLVLPADQFALWDDLCEQYGFRETYTLVEGGATRFDSVKCGLGTISNTEAIVAVHDGVRPVVSRDIIANSFTTAREHGTAVTSVALKDSVRSVQEDGTSAAIDRSKLRLIQTPQTFQSAWMRKAFEQPYRPDFTDCASVLEAAGFAIKLIEGSYENIKITTPEDLKWAEVYLK